MTTLLQNKIAVRDRISTFAKVLLGHVKTPPDDDPDPAAEPGDLLLVAYALSNDLSNFLGFAVTLTDQPNVLAVGKAAAANDHDRLLRLIPHLMAHGEWPTLTAATIFLGDRNVCNDVALLMSNFDDCKNFADLLALLAGTLETMKLECRIHEQVQVGGREKLTAGQILPRLEKLWQGKNPDDEGDDVELSTNDRMLILAAALAIAPEQ